jgi:hypothetical protein
MHVPSNWSTQKRPKTGRTKSEGIRKKSRQNHDHQEPVTIQELTRSISQSIINTTPSKLSPDLNLHTVLSDIPYRQILETLFGSDGTRPPDDIPVIIKAWEESFMRESMHPGERPCVMGIECEAQFIDSSQRFTCTEFLFPGQPRTEPQMCVLCCRKHTQKLYYDLLYNPTCAHLGVIQRYGVISGVPNEYAQESVLVMPCTGPVYAMPYPSVAHSRNLYTVHVRNTTRYLVQNKNMAFRLPSLDNESAA